MFLLKVLLSLMLVYIIVNYWRWRKRRQHMVSQIDKLPGLKQTVPVLEVLMMILQCQELTRRYRTDSYAFVYSMLHGVCRAYMDIGITSFWMGFKPIVALFSPEKVETILSSLQVLNKAEEYLVFEPWIGEGLITSKKTKWQFRRKILTPAFHFRILNDFLPILNGEATKLVKKLNQRKYLDSRRVNMIPLVSLCTLDSICETAMGTNLDLQTNEEEPTYAKALAEMAEMALARVSRPWLWSDFAYLRTDYGRKFFAARDRMHNFTMNIIGERKAEWQEILEQGNKTSKTTIHNDNVDETKVMSFEETLEMKFAQKADKRMAFLDLLLYHHLVVKNMTLEDVLEEVETFMFAGHDTTSMNINWTLYMLGLYPEIQDKVREEVDRVLDGSEEELIEELDDFDLDSLINKTLKTTDVTTKHLRDLKYLDQVIKESLRMWPSVPFVARHMTEELRVGENKEYIIPEGATCLVFTHAMHHNPNIYPKPEVFDPERFSPEESAKRHPFAFVPFSAGPRNCIGQKYAQMEVKIILAKLIRNYYFESCDPMDKLHIVGELVLRPTKGLFVRIKPRYKE